MRANASLKARRDGNRRYLYAYIYIYSDAVKPKLVFFQFSFHTSLCPFIIFSPRNRKICQASSSHVLHVCGKRGPFFGDMGVYISFHHISGSAGTANALNGSFCLFCLFFHLLFFLSLVFTIAETPWRN